MSCQLCGKEEPLPFVCNYCGNVYCGDHRLPEAHSCSGDLTRKPVVISSSTSSNFSWQSGPTVQRVHRAGVFSRIEVRDIVLAWLALSAAFLIAERGRLVLGAGLLTNLAVSIVVVGSGFVMHELMHKFTAQRYGYWAEFRMWPFGIVFALATSVMGLIFAAPGATYIKGYDVPDRQNALISLAGPATNIVIALLFLPLLLVGNIILVQAGFVGISINMFLAAFNMLPVMPLDGAKVFKWNKLIWAGIFIPLALVVAVVIFGVV